VNTLIKEETHREKKKLQKMTELKIKTRKLRLQLPKKTQVATLQPRLETKKEAKKHNE
jgi:hypothetical protein